MPSKVKKGTILNRKKLLVKELKFKGNKNATFKTGKNGSIEERARGGISLFTRNEVNKRKKLHKLLKEGKIKKSAGVQKPSKTDKLVDFGKKKPRKVKVSEKISSSLPELQGLRQNTVFSGRTPVPSKLRSSITPGTVLIILAGKWAGKRVVYLKQLASGLLLVTGPFKLNKVPLRRVHQSLVIATSSKVDISGVKVPDTVNDAFFAKAKEQKTKKAQDSDVQNKDQKREKRVDFESNLSDDRKKLQASIDEPLLAAIKNTPLLAGYLSSRFTLTNGQYPHLMKF